MEFPQRVYLTGFMGSGKSTLGKLVSDRLGYRFVDLDAHIADRQGRSAKAIIMTDGEPEFRSREREALTEVAGWSRVVVALGGGTVCSDEAQETLSSTGSVVVYLSVSTEVLAARLTQADDSRPLLLDENGNRLDVGEMRKRVADMMADREAYYRRAHVVVDATADTAEAMADRVIRAIQSYEASPD